MGIFYNDLDGILRVLATAPLIYGAVVLAFRLSGKRSTSQMNNFDWIVTVAMGSMVASPIMFRDIVLAEALTGIGLLLLLQFVVTRLMQTNEAVRNAVRAQPSLLYYRGKYRRHRMRKERISEAEIVSAIRGSGRHRLDEVAAVVLEADGTLSVIPKEPDGRAGALEILQGTDGYRETPP